MFITTMHATQCNPPRSDVQDQSVYRADLKDFWNQRLMEEATLTIWKHPFNFRKCHLHTRDDWLHSWSYHTVSTVHYKYIVRIYQLETHVIHRVTWNTASSFGDWWDWCTFMRLMYPHEIDVPSWDWCTLMRLMYPHEIDAPSWDWRTPMRLTYPHEIDIPLWDWCTLMRLMHCTLSNTQNNLLPTHGHWASPSLLPCATLGDAGFSLRHLTGCTQEWIKHNNNPFNT